MRRFWIIGLWLSAIIVSWGGVQAAEWSGYLSLEGRFFPTDPIEARQREGTISLAFQPEFYHEWPEGSSFTFVPFFRLDSADPERRHYDVRELFFLWLREDFELGLGVRKIFWGVTESQHLVDIINQTDLVEFPDAEDKLGQPMINLSVPRDWGTVDLFLMPYFRERTFPGEKGRLRTPLVVDTDEVLYESGAEEHHLDLAIRYSHTLGDWDLGLSFFQGTSREPTLLTGTNDSGTPVLVPLYEQVSQTGLDLQWIVEEWLWKLEVIHRAGQGDDFFAWTGGFEYTYTGIGGSRMDLGVISEWLRDTRADSATTPFENDLMAGLRLAVNDIAGTELLLGVIQDLDSPARLVNLEASRRMGDHFKLELEANLFIQQERVDLLYSLRDDDFIQTSLSYYF